MCSPLFINIFINLPSICLSFPKAPIRLLWEYILFFPNSVRVNLQAMHRSPEKNSLKPIKDA